MFRVTWDYYMRKIFISLSGNACFIKGNLTTSEGSYDVSPQHGSTDVKDASGSNRWAGTSVLETIYRCCGRIPRVRWSLRCVGSYRCTGTDYCGSGTRCRLPDHKRPAPWRGKHPWTPEKPYDRNSRYSSAFPSVPFCLWSNRTTPCTCPWRGLSACWS